MAPRYASLLNTLFVTFLYSAAVPLLFPIGMLCLFLTFWCERTLLFYAHRTPPKFDESLAEVALNVMPWAVFIHAAVATWTYSSPSVLSGYDIGSTVGQLGGANAAGLYSSSVATLNANSGSFSFSRVLNGSSLPNLILVLLMVAITLASIAIQRLLLCGCFRYIFQAGQSWHQQIANHCNNHSFYDAQKIFGSSVSVTFSAGFPEECRKNYRFSPLVCFHRLMTRRQL